MNGPNDLDGFMRTAQLRHLVSSDRKCPSFSPQQPPTDLDIASLQRDLDSASKTIAEIQYRQVEYGLWIEDAYACQRQARRQKAWEAGIVLPIMKLPVEVRAQIIKFYLPECRFISGIKDVDQAFMDGNSLALSRTNRALREETIRCMKCFIPLMMNYDGTAPNVESSSRPLKPISPEVESAPVHAYITTTRLGLLFRVPDAELISARLLNVGIEIYDSPSLKARSHGIIEQSKALIRCLSGRHSLANFRLSLAIVGFGGVRPMLHKVKGLIQDLLLVFGCLRGVKAVRFSTPVWSTARDRHKAGKEDRSAVDALHSCLGEDIERAFDNIRSTGASDGVGSVLAPAMMEVTSGS